MHFYRVLALTGWLGSFSDLYADAVKDREGAVRGDRTAMEHHARWIYNDLAKGFAEAKKLHKPLLIVLRCVPCLSCVGIDSSVLEEKALEPLLDQFVCVRLINANAMDLRQFQFDYDLSFSTLFFHGDGTVLGRYGSWAHQKEPQNKSLASYKATLAAVLKLYRAYPANKVALAGKQGAAIPYRYPTEIPTLSGKYTKELDWQGKVVASCVHCHQIGDAVREHHRNARQPIPEERMFPMPPPETLGITLEHSDQGLTVTALTPNSAAAAAGVQSGDVLVGLDGQALVSVADLCWVLHRAGAPASLELTVKRAQAEQKQTLKLQQGWRFQSDISGRVGTWQMRGMATGGLVLEDLPDAERKAQSISPEVMALRVKFVGQYNKHAAAKRAGFLAGDILLAVGRFSERMSEGALLGHLLQNHFPSEKLSVELLRGGRRIRLELPMQ